MELHIDCFKKNKSKPDGLQSQCISCQKKYRKDHYEKNRVKYIKKAKTARGIFRLWWIEYKKSFVCSKCPESDSDCIQFHHHDANKDMGVSELVLIGSKKRVLEEIEKCTPLCANCHIKEHARLRRLEKVSEKSCTATVS